MSDTNTPQLNEATLTLLLAKRTQYRDLLAELEVLDAGGERTTVQNCNKREVLALIEVMVGEEQESTHIVTAAAAWRGLENVGLTAIQGSQSRTVTSKDNAIVKLGHLFYLAGSQMSSVQSSALEALLGALRDPMASDRRRIVVVKALGEVCWCCGDAKRRLHALGGINTLVDCVIGQVSAPQVAQWACHTLTVAVADCAEVWLALKSSATLEKSLAEMAHDSLLWTDWDNNHAAIMLGLLKGPTEQT